MACIKIYGANKAVTYIPRVTGNTMLLFGFFSVEWYIWILSTVKPAWATNCIKQKPVLKDHLFQ
jgi:hypothetical protein